MRKDPSQDVTFLRLIIHETPCERQDLLDDLFLFLFAQGLERKGESDVLLELGKGVAPDHHIRDRLRERKTKEWFHVLVPGKLCCESAKIHCHTYDPHV